MGNSISHHRSDRAGAGVHVALRASSCTEERPSNLFCEGSKQLCAETLHLEGLTSSRNEFRHPGPGIGTVNAEGSEVREVLAICRKHS